MQPAAANRVPAVLAAAGRHRAAATHVACLPQTGAPLSAHSGSKGCGGSRRQQAEPPARWRCRHGARRAAAHPTLAPAFCCRSRHHARRQQGGGAGAPAQGAQRQLLHGRVSGSRCRLAAGAGTSAPPRQALANIGSCALLPPGPARTGAPPRGRRVRADIPAAVAPARRRRRPTRSR